MSKKLLSLALALVMSLSLCVPAFAKDVSPENSALPSWVEAGETWVPDGGIHIMDEDQSCPKGHYPPNGFTYQGYTTGQASGHYDDLAGIFGVISIFAGDPIGVKVAALSASFCAYLATHENTNLKYFKYVYTKGSTKWYHIVYVETVTNAASHYITCETYYG